MTGQPAQTIDFKVDTKGLQEDMRRAPSAVYYWLRRHLFSAFLTHRLYWLRTKTTRFGRAGENSKAIKVWRINEAPQTAKPNWVVYHVTPKEPRFRDPVQASAALQQLAGVAGAGSIVLEVHQLGKDIHVASKFLAIPLRTTPRSPKAWRKKNPGKPLITIPDPRNPSRLYLAERIRYRGRRPSGMVPRDKTKKKVVRDRLRRRFLLVHDIDMKPTLNFYESWDAQRADRDRDFAAVCTRITEDIARGKLA